MGRRTQGRLLRKRVASLTIFGLLASGLSFFAPVANANEIPMPSGGLSFAANSNILLGGRVGDSHTYENINNASGSDQVNAKVTIVELVNSATTRSDGATVRWETRANRGFAYRYRAGSGAWTYSRVFSDTEGVNASDVVYTSAQSIQAAQSGVDYAHRYLQVDENVDANGSADTADGQCSTTPSTVSSPQPCFRLVGTTEKTLEVRWAKGTRTDSFFVYRYRTSTNSGANYSEWVYSPIFPSTDTLSIVSLASDVNAVQVQRDFFNTWNLVNEANNADDAPIENGRRVGFCQATPTFDDRTPCVQDLDVDKIRAVDRLDSDLTENSYISARMRPADRRAAAPFGRATLKIEFLNNQNQPVRFENLTLNAYDVDREEYIEFEDVQSYRLSPGSTSILTVSDIAGDSRKKRFTAGDFQADETPTGSEVHSYGEARVEAQFVSIDTMFISYGFNSDTATYFDFGLGQNWVGASGAIIIPTETISQGPRLSSGSIGNGNAGTASNVYTAVATGGTSPRTFSLASQVSGFALNPTTGQLTMDSSVAAGTYTFEVRVTDNEGRLHSKLVTITVAAVVSPPAVIASPPSAMSVIDVNPTNVTVDNEIVTITGSNLHTVTDVFIGGLRVPIFTQTSNRLQVRAPSGLTGLVDLELKSSSGNVLMTKKLRFGSTTVGTGKATLIVGGFDHNSRKLTKRMKNRIDRWLTRNSDLGTLTCTGFTSLPRRTTDVTLSTNRGKTACNYSKRQRADLETSVSQGIEDPRPGSNVRRVRLVLTR